MTIVQNNDSSLIFHVDYLSRGSVSSVLSLLWKIMNVRDPSFYYRYEREESKNFNKLIFSNFHIFSSTFYINLKCYKVHFFL